MSEAITVVKLGGTEGVDFSAICADAADLIPGASALRRILIGQNI